MSSIGSYASLGKLKAIDFAHRKRFNSVNENNFFQYKHDILLDFDAKAMINEKDDALKPMDYLDEETIEDENSIIEENDGLMIIISSRSETNNGKLYSELIYSKEL